MLLSRPNSRRLYSLSITAIILIVLLLGTFYFLPVTGEDETWWNTDFEYRMKITFDNSQVGENLVNFPMPIVFSSLQNDFWSHVQAFGNDTRFVDSGNTVELYFEFEQFDYTGNNMVAWVKVPQVDAWSVTNHIWIYYGNSTCNFDSYYDSSNVWNSNYVVVMHLEETSGTFIDSSNSANDASPVGNPTYAVAGKIGPAVNLATNDYLYNSVATDIPHTSGRNLTAELWVNPNVLSGWRDIICDDYDYPSRSWAFQFKGINLSFECSGIDIGSSLTVSTGTWTHLAVSFDGSNVVFIKNGGSPNSYAQTATKTSPDGYKIGGLPSTRPYVGAMDEVRISTIKRSANWIKACYQYEVDQSRFTYASEERWVEAKLYIAPSLIEKDSGDIGTTFELNVTIESVRDLWSIDFNLTWDSTLISLVSVDINATLDYIWGLSNWALTSETYGANSYQLAAESTSNSFNNTGSTPIAVLEFRVEISNTASQTPIHFFADDLTDSQFRSITHSTEDGTYRISGKKPTLEMNPTFMICHKFGETFTVKINIIDAGNVKDFSFEILYNTTLLDYVDTIWNAWSLGSATVDEVNGNITGSTSGSAKNGNLTLATIEFSAKLYHIWKDLPGWTNNLTGAVYLQWANLSYPAAPDLHYERGGLDEIIVSSDVTYMFAPIRGDVDNDGDVDLFDLRAVAIFYDTVNPYYNLTGDSIVDIYDLVTIGSNFGYIYQ